MKKKQYSLLILTTFFLFICSFKIFAGTLPSSVDGKQLPTLADVVEAVEGGIVNISTSGTQYFDRDSIGNQLEQFFGDDEFFNKYKVAEAIYGYERNPYEVEAREVGNRIALQYAPSYKQPLVNGF